MASLAAPGSRRIRVLGVEPDAVTRALVALYLDPLDYSVHLAAQLPEALALLAQGEAGLFLCSEHALSRAGADERERLRRALGQTPVVALLEPGADPILTRGWDAVCERLSKPVRAEALLAALEGCRRERAGPPARAAAANGGSAESPTAGFERFIATAGLDAALVGDLIDSLLERTPAYLDEIAAALDGGDSIRVDRAAHTLKGMVGNLHLAALVELSDRLRLAAKANDVAAARLALAGLRQAYAEIGTALRTRWPAALP
jgi:two-component system, sensor histidine kinase and response regulator